MWAIVAGLSKAYCLTFDYVLYDMSYANVVMYSAVLPSYKTDKDGKKSDTGQKVLRADDPSNKAEVQKFFETCS